ncbi:MAG: YggU family protein [Gammaproteobacteria bacterium]|nr:YggU family protein [Gammaproteobacteria bacterium]
MKWYQWRNADLLLFIRVQPRASHNEIVGPHGEQLKVRITAPPVDGKANVHLQKFLARAFTVTKADITLLGGESGRDKRLRIKQPRYLPEAAKIPSAE